MSFFPSPYSSMPKESSINAATITIFS